VEGRSVEVTVKTPSRLHFSMIDMRGDLGRIHGSVGVAIDRPNVVLNAKTSADLKAQGPRAKRVLAFAERIMKQLGAEGGAAFELVSDIPQHSGFGSGTQLGLAVGAALSELHGLDLTPEETALILNRSMRSGIGTHAFKHGGFIVDGGHSTEKKNGVPPLIFRSDVPDDWLFVVGQPEITNNRSGETEADSFKKIKPPPPVLVGEISRIVLLQMIPAILEEDIATFGDAMTKIDYKFGEFFEEVQGGKFSHPKIEAGIGFLTEAGALGVGQSSWGPAFYGLADGESKAEELRESLEAFLNEGEAKGNAFVARPSNRGATVTRTGD